MFWVSVSRVGITDKSFLFSALIFFIIFYLFIYFASFSKFLFLHVYSGVSDFALITNVLFYFLSFFSLSGRPMQDIKVT